MTSAGEPSSSAPHNTNGPQRLLLDNLATNRVLFALALLGVLLPINVIANHYRSFAFVYHAEHDWFLKGPYHVRAILFFQAMEILLALAVYIYALDFAFKDTVFQRTGTFLYAAALLVPPIYILLALFSLLTDAIESLSTPLFYVVGTLLKIAIPIILFGITGLAVEISGRLQEKPSESPETPSRESLATEPWHRRCGTA